MTKLIETAPNANRKRTTNEPYKEHKVKGLLQRKVEGIDGKVCFDSIVIFAVPTDKHIFPFYLVIESV